MDASIPGLGVAGGESMKRAAKARCFKIGEGHDDIDIAYETFRTFVEGFVCVCSQDLPVFTDAIDSHAHNGLGELAGLTTLQGRGLNVESL